MYLRHEMLKLAEQNIMELWSIKHQLIETDDLSPAQHEILTHWKHHNDILNRAGEHRHIGVGHHDLKDIITSHEALSKAGELALKDPNKSDSILSDLKLKGHLNKPDAPAVLKQAEHQREVFRKSSKGQHETPSSTPVVKEPAKTDDKLMSSKPQFVPSTKKVDDIEKRARSVWSMHQKARPNEAGNFDSFRKWLHTHFGSEGVPIHATEKPGIIKSLMAQGLHKAK